MASHQLPIWKTLGAALDAPLSLATRSWKALALPLLALVGAIAIAFLVNYWRWSSTGWVATALLLLIATAWLALEFQRHLLLGATACKHEAPQWRRFGLYLLAMALLCVFLTAFSGLVFNFTLPTMAWMLTALNGSEAWLIAGAVVFGVLGVALLAYPAARLALILPALAVGHDAGPAQIWRLSRGKGLRLIALLVLIPGFLQGLLNLALSSIGRALPDVITGVVLGSYLNLVHAALLAYAYRALSEQTLAKPAPVGAAPVFALSARRVRTLAVVALVGLVGAALWHSLYRIAPGDTTLIVRFGKPQRVESQPGIRFKIPVIEDAQPIHKTASYHGEGDGQFLTISKESLSLKYRTQWRVTNAETYFRATGAEPRMVNARIRDVVMDLLRYRIAKLSAGELQHLIDTGSAELSVDDAPHSGALLDNVLKKANDRAKVLGIEITTWRVEVVDTQAS
jgi:hypothetical protein